MANMNGVLVDQLLVDGEWHAPGALTWDAAGLVVYAGPAKDKHRKHLQVIAGTAVPGMPNLHSHAFQRVFAGRTEHGSEVGRDSFWSWREAMYAFAESLDLDDAEAIAAQLQVEMLEAGYTSLGEFHYLHHAPDGRGYEPRAAMAERLFAAAKTSGLRMVLLPVLYATGGIESGKHTAPSTRQRRFIHRDVDGFLGLVEDCRALGAQAGRASVGLALHSLRAVTPEIVREVLAGMDGLDPKAPIHIHAAEQVAEVEAVEAAFGSRPVRWLLDEAKIDSRWCVVHATHLSNNEVRDLARSDAVVGVCPTTEADLGDGVFQAVEYLKHKGAFGIGSDSHVAVDPAEELRLLEWSQRLVRQERNVLRNLSREMPDSRHVGSSLWQCATVGGRQALGAGAEPALSPGAAADFVVLDSTHPRLIGAEGDAVLDAYVFGGGPAAVRDVFVGGEHLVQEGCHVRRDAVRTAFDDTLRRTAAAPPP